MLSPVTLFCTGKKECVFSWAVLLFLGLILYQSHKLVYNSFSEPVATTADNGQRHFSESTINTHEISLVSKKQQHTNMKDGEETKERKDIINFNITERQLKAAITKEGCNDMMKNPRSWWRTKYLDTTFSADDDYSRISLAYKCGAMVFLDHFMLTPPRESLYPFEKEYFHYPPLIDMMDFIDETFTTVNLLNNSKTFKVGDQIVILIHARDFHNKNRIIGGDEIRVWLKTDLTKKAANRVTAQVVDLKNGSYIAKALLPWAGKLRLFVALAYPSQYIRAILQVHQMFKGLKMIAGKFENVHASEVTSCYHATVIPGFSFNDDVVCNLTSLNGSPWFCGHPLKKSLSCQDYKFTRVVDGSNYNAMTITNEEYRLLQRADSPPRKRIISSSIYLTVEPNSGRVTMAPSEEMCHSIDPRKTWKPQEPSGYILEGKWQSFLCARLDMKARECFKNKHVIFLGDSNARAHYDLLKSTTNCKAVLARSTKIWHKPLKCVSQTFNTVISWTPHSQPFLSYSDRWTSIQDLVPSTHVIDQAPFDNRQHWVVLHHYIHLTSFHLSAFEAKYRAIKDAISRLIDRLPNVRVVVQGVHIAWEGWTKKHYTAGDQLGKFMRQIQRDVFRDLQDKVFFVPFWDMSTALENTSYHPNGNGQMTEIVLGYLCDK